MAIALDLTTLHKDNVSSSIGFSHTCTGSSLVLFISVAWDDTVHTITALSYNGAAATLINTQQANGGTVALYYLIGPATGSHTVAVTFSGSTNSTTIAASYTGASQTIQPDATTSTTSASATLNVIGSSSWIIAVTNATGIGGGLAAGSGFTLRQSGQLGSGSFFIGFEDSNGTVSAGNNTVAFSSTITNNLITASIRIPATVTNLTAAVGSFAYTGYAAVLVKAIGVLVAATKAFILTGYAATLRYVPFKWLAQTKNSGTFTAQSKNTSSWNPENKDI